MTTSIDTIADFAPRVARSAAGKRGVFRRLLDALIESRMRTAEREIRRHYCRYGIQNDEPASVTPLTHRTAGENLPFKA